uniref:Secreted in xylem 1 n=1 Tax=Fusarium oxysporum f. sp. sesami TaxID=654397 RepID=A0A6G6A9U6_FUSOX|nr:secreted in xylem 1 [Fusarium oxysporum f. sp. sesami]
MVPYSMTLLGAVSILGFGAYAQEAAVQEPQIYFNLTYTEHLEKVALANGRSSPDTDVPWEDTSDIPWTETDDVVPIETGSSLSRRGHNIKLGKREPVGGETRNDRVTNDMLQALHDLCVQKLGPGHRASSGRCRGEKYKIVECGKPMEQGRLGYATADCAEHEICTTFEAINFRGNRAHFPVCGPRIRVADRVDVGRHTEWEGTWYPESPKSPGTYDSFAQMAGSLNGYFDFNGAYSNGEGFSSRGSGHSWSCINCPGGKLTITSTERATWAVGYTSPH